MAVPEPVTRRTASRVFEGRYCEDGYEFAAAGQTAGWQPVASWGADGWDLGDWPYVVYLFRGDTERASYCEGDLEILTYATAADRELATDDTAWFYWQARGEEWIEGIDPDARPDYLRGPSRPNRDPRPAV